MRLDVYLTDNGISKSRERAKTMIKSGCVKLNGAVCTKPAAEVAEGDKVEADDSSFDYVGRGLIKLETAFQAFDLDIADLVCADIGASTGGFTQCMLKRGAKLVYAVDVGSGQLDPVLLNDDRVVNMEGVNARYLTPADFPERPQFISVDLSFISLTQVMPALVSCLDNGGKMVVLIKPQFEAGKAALNKKGIVRDKKRPSSRIAGYDRVFHKLRAFRGGDSAFRHNRRGRQ
ncbi:TlyA family RNA methyltransferase [Ruminococcus albus]|uniref:23S rRNA (Cytidine1920-2'-O)/16S rRNA (Cytidine1409-2'-O)-methyltransferase n=1 Tax=Ruminococcus albus TaxID=1264 RepID=A0A1I1E1N2_RUMAL|nr:TlyA family RNA methyltransferase [Ruminococcus albus]SFB81105.1 23S rRNA (cytidine1920-2'-O)/16S rRNA (cytidine1409-2'-O)-methyltransferase [Ruminococcus albus]